MAGVRTRLRGPNPSEERSHQRQGLREPPGRGRERPSSRKNGRGQDRLWGSSRRAEDTPAARRERRAERGHRVSTGNLEEEVAGCRWGRVPGHAKVGKEGEEG